MLIDLFIIFYIYNFSEHKRTKFEAVKSKIGEQW